jgi:NDP-sugar pyrophosphorylase family protein
MKVDNVLILGAGLGTRMGPVGKILPKLLWPVFEKSLLELQVELAKEFSPKKIFINTHYEADKIHSHIETKNIDVEYIHEEELLDIGGGIHNLANKLNYSGKLLILNGDQFLFFDTDTRMKLLDSADEFVVSLLGLEVEFGSNYNELKCVEGLLKNIEKPSGDSKNYLTYSGVSLINLEMLNPSSGVSKFFDTVADFKNVDVNVIKPTQLEYCDFGTAKRYLESMRRVLSLEYKEMRNFLERVNGINTLLVKDNTCYNTRGEAFSINLTSQEVLANGSIVLEAPSGSYPRNSIVFGDLISGTN